MTLHRQTPYLKPEYNDPRPDHVSLNIMKKELTFNMDKLFELSSTEGVIISDVKEDYVEPYDYVFLGQDVKIVSVIAPSLSHIIEDTLSDLLRMASWFPKSEIVFVDNGIEKAKHHEPREGLLRNNSLLDSLEKALVLQGHRVSYITASEKTRVSIDNFVISSPSRSPHGDFKGFLQKFFGLRLTSELFRSTFVTDHADPTEKIYVSRSKTTPRDVSVKNSPHADNSFILDDVRLYNEKLLEEYFKSLGFVIVYAEEFESYEDQVRFFASAKVIAGVTGAGLWNALFMKSGGLVLEISTPLATSDNGSPMVDYHPHYATLAYAMGMNYLAIPSSLRHGSEIVDKIENNLFLRKSLEC
jgi:hypothetical protein